MSGAIPQINVKEDKKPNVQLTRINLRVKNQDGEDIFFKVKRTSLLKRLMEIYCDKKSQDLKTTIFLYDGRPLRAKDTFEQLEMEDGDEIDAMLHQTGGGV